MCSGQVHVRVRGDRLFLLRRGVLHRQFGSGQLHSLRGRQLSGLDGTHKLLELRCGHLLCDQRDWMHELRVWHLPGLGGCLELYLLLHGILRQRYGRHKLLELSRGNLPGLDGIDSLLELCSRPVRHIFFKYVHFVCDGNLSRLGNPISLLKLRSRLLPGQHGLGELHGLSRGLLFGFDWPR